FEIAGASIFLENEKLWKHAAVSTDLVANMNVIEIVNKEKRYKSKLKEWHAYNKWKEERNPQRAVLEAKFGYDCYSADDTEFLTKNGWKSFDSISEQDELATIFVGEPTTQKEKFELEYQKYIDKFDGTFTGEMYRLYGYHTDVLVTPNHRMLVQELEKNNHKIKGNWKLEEISRLSNCFQCLRNITPNKKNHKEHFPETKIPKEAFLKLMGWYLSDGSVNKKRTITISQKKNGKLYSSMKKFANKYEHSNLYEYVRNPNDFNPNEIIEAVLTVCSNDSEKIINDCGKTKNKSIPRWVFSLSKYKMNILLDALIMGDGTKSRPDNSMIYYSSSKKLANDVQELAFLCGYETSLYGPYDQKNEKYEIHMYQVHINKTREQFKTFYKSANIEKIPYVNKKIVCFTVPNGTLITRRNGHVAIHGNSKHAMHLVRLMRMCEEILATGEIRVKRPDAKELLEIRDGAWTYEELIAWSEQQELKIQKLYDNTNVVPKEPNRKEIEKLCRNLVETYLYAT
ncbi:MAG TPA: LAGLIDADG family homing endonuclease, partial [Candidatus Glassbacteria bacterium]|nr:LAGLIDADG family homing endonuclease [Candidatus Glassbacteria bacterium]